MKFQLHIFVRDFANVDILQKGWNYLAIYPQSAQLKCKLLSQTYLLYDPEPGRDPLRFLGSSPEFLEQNNQILSPQFRIEFFDQVVQIRRELVLELETNQQDAELSFAIKFQHFPGVVPLAPPPRTEATKTFERVLKLTNIKTPAATAHWESFSETHLARLEMAFVWRGTGQDQLFNQIYGDSFENVCHSLCHPENIVELLKYQNTLQQTMHKQQVRKINATTADQVLRSVGEPVPIQPVVAAQPPAAPRIYLKSSTGIVTESVIMETDIIEQIKTSRVLDKAVESSETDELFDNREDRPLKPAKKSQNSTPVTVPVSEEISRVIQSRIGSIAVQRYLYVNAMPVQAPQIFEVQMPRMDYAAILSSTQLNERYTGGQLDLLLRQQSDIQHEIVITRRYMQLQQQHPQTYQQQPRTVHVFVHGFRGSQNDFRYLRLLFDQQLRMKGQHPTFINLDFSRAADTSVLELGYLLNIELQRSLMTEFGVRTLDEALDQIYQLDFVGFSLGNTVIQSIVAQMRLGADDVSQMAQTLYTFDALAAADQKPFILSRQFRPHRSLLSKLGGLFSINGPLLGLTQTNVLVATGYGFMKAFGRRGAVACIADLENRPVPRAELLRYQHKIGFVREVLDLTTAGRESARLCRARPVQGFDGIFPLDVLAFNSRLGFFRRITAIGTVGDGYVDFKSAIALPTSAAEQIVGLNLRSCTELRRIVVKNAPERYGGGAIDRGSGRSFHIGILVDLETVERVARILQE